ncbi:MAG: hypothetical protein KIC76_04625 [Firmicutes bacterium]|jgi:ABC-type antimicrobial peptide transport system permease subunit|nr:hypothetical protein [Bacillota bacterium]
MGLNIDYEAIANYIIIIGAIIIFVTIIKSILPILTYNELKKQRKLLEQISKDVSDIKDRYL